MCFKNMFDFYLSFVDEVIENLFSLFQFILRKTGKGIFLILGFNLPSMIIFIIWKILVYLMIIG